MLRKIVSLILAVLMVTMLSASAMASGILPSFEEFAPDPAVSFGVTVGKDPISETTLEDGSIQQRYVLVTDDDYTAFGVRLGDADYTIASQETLDNGIAVVVTNGSQSMEVRYLRGDGEMLITYPAGTEIERPAPVDLFPGYIRVNFGEETTVAGFGKFTFNDFVLSGSCRICNHLNTVLRSEHNYRATAYTWLTFKYLNTTNKEQKIYADKYASGMLSDLSPSLVYINADGRYTYPLTYAGRFKLEGDEFELEPLNNASHEWTVGSMDSIGATIVFDVPSTIRQSTDGTIAVTFKSNGQYYVLYLRENGKDLF